jgi:hypothetical protein
VEMILHSRSQDLPRSVKSIETNWTLCQLSRQLWQGSSTTCLRRSSTHSVVVSVAVPAKASASTTLKMAFAPSKNPMH